MSFVTKAGIEVRKHTFDDVINDVPVLELPIIFTGSFKEVMDFCQQQPGFVWKDSKMMLPGGYFYNKTESVALLLT